MKETKWYLTAEAVRSTTGQVWEALKKGETHFVFHSEKLSELADFVSDLMRKKYPDLNIPYHSRWGHFKAGGAQRLNLFFNETSEFDKKEQARRQIDLVIPSVLLDAGAGSQWQFKEPHTEFKIGRSEGLGIASFYMFYSGVFSSFSQDPLRADSQSLLQIKTEDVAKAFQVSDQNPLEGLEGRASLVRSLGEAVKSQADIFVGDRPGGLVDYFENQFGPSLPAPEILKALLVGLQNIWPGRIQKENMNLGDVWEHSQFGLLAFHKLSQWLTYSLLEPLEEAGFEITQLDQLTGLAEYRNGGLFVDGGVLEVKQPVLLQQPLPPSHDLILEWRALTIHLLDQMAPLVRQNINKSENEFPLAKVLEGGTWWAGRELAREKRPDGSPPIEITSDGTVF